jgi:tetratricopeptide (TPR) repeat protein
VIVEGESGVGKTSLVNRFVEVANALEKRVLVLHGRCHERERVTFNALDGVIDELARYLVRRPLASVERVVPAGSSALLAVFPALRMVQALADAAALERPMRDVRGTAFIALRELFVRLGKRRGVVIVIDDLQWADNDSAMVLGELLRPGDSPRICVVGTKRAAMPDAVTQQLRALSCDVERIDLAGLDQLDAEELVRLVSADAAPGAIIAETQGHPLFLRELARNPSEGGVRLEDAIRRRAERHEDAARALLNVVCVAGAPSPRQVVADLAGLATPEADIAINALLADRLVRVHGPRPQDAIEPFHDRIRAAIYSDLPRDRQRALHLSLANALEAMEAPASLLLAHYDAAGDASRSLQYLIAAADAARAAFAFSRAAELYRRAVETPGVLGMQRATLLVHLADSLANDGRTAEAATRYLQAAHLHPEDSAPHVDLLRRSAERFLMSGRVEDGLQTARQVLERAGMILPQSRARAVAGILWNQIRMRGSALNWTRRTTDRRSLDADIAWSIGAGLGMIDSLLGAYFSGRAARLALREGSALQITRGMAAASIGASLLGRQQRANRLHAAVEQAAREDGSTLAAWYLRFSHMGKAFILDNNFKLAHEHARALEAEWYAAGYGPGWETDVAMHFSLASQMMLGQHGALSQRVNELVRGAVRSGDLFQEVTLRVRFAVRHLIADAPDVARADVAEALGAWLPGTDSFGNQRAWALWSRGRIELYAGQLNPPGLEAEWKRMHRSLIGRLPMMQVEWLHGYATYLLGRALDAKRRGLHSEHLRFCRGAERVYERYKKLDVFYAAPVARELVRAGLAWVRGDADLIDRLRIATAIAEERGIYAMVAGVRRRLGEAIGGDEGAALVAKSELEHRGSGFVDPARATEFAIPTGRFS